MSTANTQPTPVNIFTGFLGAGKTTVIMHLLEQLPNPEKTVWLKNEYGDVNVDKLMMQTTHVQVQELMNGCLCCVLVGRLHNALLEIMESYKPERILIETSGTAYPGPIVWEVEKIPQLRVDSVVNIIDAVNFQGYEDISYASRLQTKVNDLIIINKYPANPSPAEENEIEGRLDDVYDLNPHTPKIKTTDGKVDSRLMIGLDTNNLEQLSQIELRSLQVDPKSRAHHHEDEVEVFEISFPKEAKFDLVALEKTLENLQGKGFIRIKGVVQDKAGQTQILNWVYGRNQYNPLNDYAGKSVLVFMGKHISAQEEQLTADLEIILSSKD